MSKNINLDTLMLKVVAGQVGRVSYIRKFGNNPDIDQAANEDIWDGGGLYQFPTSACSLEVVSSDTNDAAAGTGARTISVFGLDEDYTSASEGVTLAGTTACNLTGSYIRVYRAYVVTAGTGGSNAGNVDIQVQGGGQTLARIKSGINQILMAVYTIPAATTGYLLCWYYSLSGKIAANVETFLKTRPFDEVFQVKSVMALLSAGSSHHTHSPSFPLKLNAKTDIRIESDTDTNNTSVSAGFDILLVDN